MESNLRERHYFKTQRLVHLCMEQMGWWSALVRSRIAQLRIPQWESSCPESHHHSLYYILRVVNTGLWTPVSHSQVAHTGGIQIRMEHSKLSIHSLCPHFFLAGCCLDKPVLQHSWCHRDKYECREEKDIASQPKTTFNIDRGKQI